MINYRPILLVNGILLIILSGAMLFPALVDYSVNNEDWKVFIGSSLFTAFFGVSLFLTNRGFRGNLSIRETFLFTTSAWVILPVFAAIPFYFNTLGMSFTDSIFEATSGITTTGSTVIEGLSKMPPGILLWRAILNGLGGIGIIVLAMAVLPVLSIGGMQLFKSESSDNMGKILPRAKQIAGVISGIFVSLIFACALIYWILGMNGFDAICHAITTVATAGFTNYDKSIGHYDNYKIEIVAMFFMLVGSLPIILYYQLLKGDIKPLVNNSQVRWFLAIVFMSIVILALYRITQDNAFYLDTIRKVAFTVVAIVTTTGYTATDYNEWEPFATTFLFMLCVVGGCTGSTAGGMKIFRFQVLYATAKSQIQKLIQPNGVFVPKYNNRPISNDAMSSVITFLILFAFSFLILAISLSFFGLDFLTSMSAAAQALANVGPGLGDIIGPSGNYSGLPDGAKWILLTAMVIGRLELFTVLVLFSSRFWKD